MMFKMYRKLLSQLKKKCSCLYKKNVTKLTKKNYKKTINKRHLQINLTLRVDPYSATND